MNNRWKNYGLWTSIASLLLLLLQTSGYAVDLGKWNDVVNSVLTIAVSLGLINNPATENRGFLDDGGAK